VLHAWGLCDKHQKIGEGILHRGGRLYKIKNVVVEVYGLPVYAFIDVCKLDF
jgi:hypothetical protein